MVLLRPVRQYYGACLVTMSQQLHLASLLSVSEHNDQKWGNILHHFEQKQHKCASYGKITEMICYIL